MRQYCVIFAPFLLLYGKKQKNKNVPTMQRSRFMKRPLLDPWKKPCSNVEFLSAELLKCDSSTHGKNHAWLKMLMKSTFTRLIKLLLLNYNKMLDYVILVNIKPPPPRFFESLHKSRSKLGNINKFADLLKFAHDAFVISPGRMSRVLSFRADHSLIVNWLLKIAQKTPFACSKIQ